MAPLSPLPPPSMDQKTICVACGGKGYVPQRIQCEIAADICAVIYCNEDRMRRLLSEHAELEKRTEELRAQLASVSQPTPDTLLPPEVLSEIFGLALGGDSFNVSDIKTGPWAFGYVCSSWRFAACGDPTIWTSILVDNSSVTVGASDKVSISYPRRDPASLLSTVLFRSNQRDMNIVFNISGDKRWKSASICVPPELVPMLDAVEGNIPRLSKLHIGLSNVDGYVDPHIPPVPLPLVAAFSVAPALKEVSFDSLGVGQVVDLPWSQMTSLTDTCEFVQPRTCAKILSLSPHLKTLHLKYSGEIYESPMIEANKIVSAELQSLTICSSLFLEKVEFPQLTRLTISPTYLILNMSDAIITMIASSRCRLQYLHMDRASLDVWFFEILASTPELTELELCFTRWNDSTQNFEDFVPRVDARTESGHYRKAGQDALIFHRWTEEEYAYPAKERATYHLVGSLFFLRILQDADDEPESKETIAAEICMLIQNMNDHPMRLLHSKLMMLSQRNEGPRQNPASSSSLLDTAPNYRLPSEVLSEIFWMTLDGKFFNVSHTKKSPWALSYVCRPWRSAACGDPRLWTSILVDDRSAHVPASSTQYLIPLSVTKPRKDPVSLLSTVLSRLNQRDVSVMFNISNKKVKIRTKSTIIAPLQKVMEHSARWKYINICLPSQLVPMLNAVEGNIPHLNKLHFALSDAPAVLSLPITAFKTAPFLRVVSFRGIGADKFKGLPWSQVTSLTDVQESAGSYRSYTDILSSAPRLRILIFKYRSERHLSMDEDPIVHACLKSLTVCSDVFMEQVELPQLIRLTVIVPLVDHDINGPINALITSSGCQLQFLHVDFAIVDAGFFEILDSTPGLVHLKLNYPQWRQVHDESFDDFALRMEECSDRGKHEILPALRSLEITVQKDEVRSTVSSFAFINSDLVNVVVSRWKVGALRNFRFEADTTRVLEDLSLEDVAGLKKVKKEGLGISVVTTSNGFCYTTGHWDLRFDQEDHRRVYV
ncbi:hypothetical protein EDD85DRAFT_979752 [Armillaria nabsnona]|nr:hypothetical protein EDD85DRAFT_979752 [Armillaria nabsnona]